MCRKVGADLNNGSGISGSLLKAPLKSIYRLAAKDPDAFYLKVLNKVPGLSSWDIPLKNEAQTRAAAMIAQLGIPNPEEVVRLYPHNLSGGMKQRVVIAIALACNPRLLIADEATSNLDVTIQAQILDLLKELKASVIASVLLITHDLGIVAETCDRVGVMYAGQLCEVADVKDLFKNPLHPYTRALLEAVPRYSQEEELKSIDGNVPNLVDPPAGCRFHPRCMQARKSCSQAFPETIDTKNGHLVSCYLYTDKPRQDS
jgi:peptide/nickel transport system ATP-binding protein